MFKYKSTGCEPIPSFLADLPREARQPQHHLFLHEEQAEMFFSQEKLWEAAG